MEWLQGQIELYHRLFLGCFGIFIAGTAASIALFIKFRIRHMFGVKSGRTRRRMVKQWEKSWEKQEQESREVAAELLKEAEEVCGEGETEALNTIEKG